MTKLKTEGSIGRNLKYLEEKENKLKADKRRLKSNERLFLAFRRSQKNIQRVSNYLIKMFSF